MTYLKNAKTPLLAFIILTLTLFIIFKTSLTSFEYGYPNYQELKSKVQIWKYPKHKVNTISKRYCNVHDFNSYMNTSDPKLFECVKTTAIADLLICLYPSRQDIIVSEYIRKGGVWEGNINREIIKTLKQFPNASFIDMGANIGMHALVAAKLGHNVLAIEPKMENIKRLHKSVNLNKFNDRFILIENGISNIRANFTIYTFPKNQGAARLEKPGTSGKSNEVIETVLMDDLLEVFHDKQAILKMDIEGSEANALLQSREFFSAVDVRLIFMEWDFMRRSFKSDFYWQNDRNNSQAMVRYLRELGFQPRDMQNQVLEDKYMANWPGDMVWIKV